MPEVKSVTEINGVKAYKYFAGGEYRYVPPAVLGPLPRGSRAGATRGASRNQGTATAGRFDGDLSPIRRVERPAARRLAMGRRLASTHWQGTWNGIAGLWSVWTSATGPRERWSVQ
jgi:hypothetical protein